MSPTIMLILVMCIGLLLGTIQTMLEHNAGLRSMAVRAKVQRLNLFSRDQARMIQALRRQGWEPSVMRLWPDPMPCPSAAPARVQGPTIVAIGNHGPISADARKAIRNHLAGGTPRPR